MANKQVKDVIVIGGGDTGPDCIGTSNRHSKNLKTLRLCQNSKHCSPTTLGLGPLRIKTSSHAEGRSVIKYQRICKRCIKETNCLKKTANVDSGQRPELVVGPAGTGKTWSDLAY
jgi:hypothetical protein